MSKESFETLLAASMESVRRLVIRNLRNRDQADDILQQTVLRAFVCREQLRAPSKFRNWLWSIALNEIRMHIRAARPSVPLEVLPDYPFADRAPSPLAICEQTEKVEWIRAAMATLTLRDRTAIELADLQGLTMDESARAMATSKAAFKSILFRARQRLGRALRPAQPLPQPPILPRPRRENVYRTVSTFHDSRADRVAA
ncbi:MAG TPA: sigma-70 family RNA polymerase sigma factor [Bryobacteraceae bacterium]|nr:sigma-70 family RNA polymerase sigma factor [Bryobacteraceae bacterium]